MLRDGKGFSNPITLASAATTDIGGQNSQFVEISGTTTITSLGSTYNGPRFLRFTGALTLTHNATALNIPGTANITTAAGDTCVAVPNLALNGWNIIGYQLFATAPANYAKLNASQAFTAAQRGSISALTDGATITPDFSLANNYSVTLAGNRTLANPTNITAGQSGVIAITQDATGTRTLAYGTYFKFPNGTVPSLSTAANAIDVLTYYAISSTQILANLIKGIA